MYYVCLCSRTRSFFMPPHVLMTLQYIRFLSCVIICFISHFRPSLAMLILLERATETNTKKKFEYAGVEERKKNHRNKEMILLFSSDRSKKGSETKRRRTRERERRLRFRLFIVARFGVYLSVIILFYCRQL